MYSFKNKTEGFKTQCNNDDDETNTSINTIKDTIIQNPNLIEDIEEVLEDPIIKRKIDNAITSKPILNKVHNVVGTPEIRRQIRDIVNMDPTYKKINREIHAVKVDVHDEMKKFRKDIVKEVKEMMEEAPESEKQNDTPYVKIMKAHNKLTEDNNNVLNKIQRELAEIKHIREQIEKTEEMQKLNEEEQHNLSEELDSIHNSRARAQRDLLQYKQYFKELVEKNLVTHKKISDAKEKIKQDNKQYAKHLSEIKRLKIRMETTSSEKMSAESNINMLNAQLREVKENGSMRGVLKKQIEQLERQKQDIEINEKEIQRDLSRELSDELQMAQQIENNKNEIKYLENEHQIIESQIADIETKSKMEQTYIRDFEKEIEDYKNKMSVRNRNSTLLENELNSLMKQYETVAGISEVQQLKALKRDSNENKKNIREMQITIKRLKTKPDGYPIANWNFSKASLKDQNNKFQSESIGNINFETILGRHAAIYKGTNHIKILDNINTSKFKSITLMINILNEPGTNVTLWSLLNPSDKKCKDSMFSRISSKNNISFDAKYNCNGPEIMSSEVIPSRVWQHLAFVFNKHMNEVKLYINGKQMAFWNDPSNSNFMNKLYANLYIGNYENPINTNMAIAWFRMFDYSLRPIDIAKDMNNEWDE
jgi:hypothetical protein